MPAPDLTTALALAEEHQRLAAAALPPALCHGSRPPWRAIDISSPGGAHEATVVDARDHYVCSVLRAEDAALIAHGRVALDVLAATLRTHAPVLRAVAEWVAAHRAVSGRVVMVTTPHAERMAIEAAKRRLTAAADALAVAVDAIEVSP